MYNMKNPSVRVKVMEGRGRYLRSSQRSRGSSLLSEADAREKIKECCRKFVAFMCTQVGVGGLVVCYTIVGAFSFSKVESVDDNMSILNDNVTKIRIKYAKELWDVAQIHNVLNETGFFNDTDFKLIDFQKEIVFMIKKGWDGRVANEIWSFPAALMFSLSIITMIGYGNMVPKTGWGRLLTVLYAIFGIPLYILYFLNMGKVLASCFRWVYTWFYECSSERRNNEPPKRVIVPSTACLWVIFGYVFTGALMFAQWEKWSYLDSTYFCVTSLCKLGFGDFVPGAASKSGNSSKLVINFIYMLVGLGLVAMCYNLMREEIKVKMQEMREDFRQCLEDTRVKLLNCYVKPQSMLGALTPTCPLRLCTVSGYDGRINDVLYSRPLLQANKQTTLVYFGGDVQDFGENMENHRDNKNYLKWSLENTAQLLQTSFPESHILVVRPSRMDYKTFSCFENFVPSGNCGVPEHTPMYHALHHLEKLLENVSSRLSSISDNELDEAVLVSRKAMQIDDSEEIERNNKSAYIPSKVELDKNDIILVGFSKGCVVLNQFLYEFHYFKTLTPDDQTMMGTVSRIKEMYWLDGGHSGGKNTWITSRPLLETFTRLGITAHIHVSPYQIQDERRPWIKKEEKTFYDVLCKLGAPVHRTVHFNNVFPNLFLHFDVLTVFKQNTNSSDT